MRKDQIRENEVAWVFSDRNIAQLAVLAGLPKDADIRRLAAGIRVSAQVFARDVCRSTPNALRSEIDALCRAAVRRRYEDLAQRLENLSDSARELIEGRALNIRSRVGSAGQSDDWALREPKELKDPDRRDAACKAVLRLIVTGRHVIDGRRRPGGKRSRELRVNLHAPTASRSEPRREAERTFVMWLRTVYWSATGRMPPSSARHNMPGPFARMVAECLRLVRAPASDLDHDRAGLAVQLINDIDRERSMRKLIDDWRRILKPLRSMDDSICRVGRLIEYGNAIVSRIPFGGDADAVAEQPALIMFEETGTLSFYVSPSQWRTITVKQAPRARIMQLAELLQAANTPGRRARIC